MKRPPEHCRGETLRWFSSPARRRFLEITAVVITSLWCVNACGQFSPPDKNSARSVSGQFIINATSPASRLAGSPRVMTDTNLIRLEPALLAVSAERIKELLWRKLEITGRWRGQIYLVLRPAQSLDEEVTIISKPFASGWNYRVELPDVLTNTRFTRALTGVLLMEIANRAATSQPAKIPAWLTEGLSQQLLTTGVSDFLLSSPNSVVNGLPVTRQNITEHGLDALAATRQVLAASPALTFEQLSWPTGDQLNGDDGGVYRASAHLFVTELLNLKNGPARLRAMLESLPHFLNDQTAFLSAFHAEFPRPLDLEKWWALKVVGFAARDPGPGWTLAISEEKLSEILRVPVAMRVSSNSLPVHTEVSLQMIIRNMEPARQVPILQTRLRDLELAQFRVTPSLAGLVNGYRSALENYLGKKTATTPQSARLDETLKRLDTLDSQRRTLVSTLKPEPSVQPNLNPLNF